MHWINISCASIDAPEFMGSEPIDRATWLCLLRYCVGMENSGRIVACRDWPDRQWQQTAGVTKAEIERGSKLWEWEGKNLIVWAYPIEQQRAQEAKRKGGRKGAKLKYAKNGARAKLPNDPSESKPSSTL